MVPGTVTSMEPNESTFVLHPDSNKPKLDEFLPHAAGIVFVVDSLEFLPNCRLASDDKLRASRSAISAADISNDFTLGVPAEAFAFSRCRNKVTVAESSGLTSRAVYQGMLKALA
ncbi:hypothetical protein V6N13_133963 [Hibiscus sabdariffa]